MPVYDENTEPEMGLARREIPGKLGRHEVEGRVPLIVNNLPPQQAQHRMADTGPFGVIRGFRQPELWFFRRLE